MWKAALIGVIVAFLCLLPPILHFVTGPLSPAIGGFVGGMQLPGRRRSLSAVIGMAAVMTTLLTAAITVIAAIGLTIAASVEEGEPAVFDGSVLVLIALFAAIYIFGLSLIGGLFGSSFRR